MKTYYKVMVRGYSPDGERHYKEYTGRIWDDEHILDAHDELWDALHDEDVEGAYIMEVTA